MARLANNEFLAQVGSVLEKNNGGNSVYITQKRLVLEVEPPLMLADLPQNVVTEANAPNNITQYPVLVRLMMNGDKKGDKLKKLKLSTVVETAQLADFWNEYAQVLKNGLVGLKKEKKKKNKKKVTK